MGRILTTPTKFDFVIPTSTPEAITEIIDEPQNSEYIHLKHFLDNDEESSKNDQELDIPSRSSTPDVSQSKGKNNNN